MERLILWDVDGTLLSTDGIAAEEMRAAMRAVIGPSAPMARTSYAGKTDWRIIRESLPHLDPAEIAERLDEFTAAYYTRLLARREELKARSRLFPGVRTALEALHGRVRQAPLTGNIAPVARLKLECVGLLELLDVEAGAYGNDHHHRPELVPIASRRAAARYGSVFAGPQIVVVGDTPYDIDCGKVNGTRTIAVATGPYSQDELRSHDPELVLPDLADTTALVAAILG